MLSAWGGNKNCELGPNLNSKLYESPIQILAAFPGKIKKFSCGGYHAMVITEEDKLYSWGWNGYVFLFSEFFVKVFSMQLIVVRYGTLGVGNKTDRRTPACILEDVEEVAGGQIHCLALKKDGSLWAWGKNHFGQVGIPGEIMYLTPQQVPKFWASTEDICGIGCGGYYSWVITCSGDLYTWGQGEGYNSRENREVPQEKLKVILPPYSARAQWEKIFKWLFLGKSDSCSTFQILPVEVTFHTVSVWNNSIQY
jgi:alpha-tubulin suppressor-like RCC1 family protein